MPALAQRTILIGSDHAGFELKQMLLDFLRGKNIQLQDMGPASFEPEDDFPDTLAPLLRKLSADPENSAAIILGGSGQGEAIFANRFPHVRAAVYHHHDPEIVRLSRQHNNSNVLSLGARFLTPEQAREAVWLWLNTPFSGEPRHQRRIEKIESVVGAIRQ